MKQCIEANEYDDLYLSIFLHPAQHDNGSALVVPDHPPEVIDSVLHWSLCSNVSSTLTVALKNTIMTFFVIYILTNPTKDVIYINKACINVV